MALQEFLASYAVQVDEDGARRLQRILDENREAGRRLAEVFSAARSALAVLKKELSETSGLRNILSGLFPGSSSLPSSSISGRAASGGSSYGSAIAGAGGSSFSGSFSGSLSGFLSGDSVLGISADFSAADKAFSAFRSRMEAERPRLQVNTSGITSAVSSAVSSVRAMLSSVQVTVPVTAIASLDTSNLWGGSNPYGNTYGNTYGGSSGGTGTTRSGGNGTSAGSTKSGSTGSSGSGSSGTASSGSGSSNFGSRATSLNYSRYGLGGRIASPTLALIAEEGKPEYVIPVENETRALPLIRSMLAEMSASAKSSLKRELLSSMTAHSEHASAGDHLSSGRYRTELTLIGKNSHVLSSVGNSSSEQAVRENAFSEQSARGNGLSGLSSSLSSVAQTASFAFDSLQAAISDLSRVAREAFRSAGGASAPAVQSVQAPVTIHVTAPEAAPEAVARSIYDTAQRSLLKTLKGVFV